MKTVPVPAEVFSVRDTIVGKLTFEQLGLLVLAGVGMVYVYVVVVPQSQITIQKGVLSGVLAVICAGLAWRWGDRLVIEWLGLGLAYRLRPKVWIYDKSVSRQDRQVSKQVVSKPEKKVEKRETRAADPMVIGLVSSKLRLDLGKKGRLYVESK